MFLWPTSSHIHGLIFPLGRSRARSFHTSPAVQWSKVSGLHWFPFLSSPSDEFDAWSPIFFLFWTPTKTNPRKPVTSVITQEELLQQLLTIPGHRYSSSKLHIHLYKRNLMTFSPKQILSSKIQKNILFNNSTVNNTSPAHCIPYC